MARIIYFGALVVWILMTGPVKVLAIDSLSTPIKIQEVGTQTKSSASDGLQLENQRLRDSLTNLKISQSTLSIKTPDRFIVASWVAFICLLLWLLLVIYYFNWAIRRYTMNYGLSDEEWKVLHPALYAKKGEQALYEKKKADMILANVEKSAAGEAPSNQPFEEPTENPHKNDSFGLPPGTLRGTLTLTAMVCIVLIEGVNLFSPINLENHFADLLIVFKMIIGFYFGSKALEVLESKRAEVKKHEATMGATVTNPGAVAAQSPTPSTSDCKDQSEIASKPNPELTQGVSIAKRLELPSEKPAVIEGLTPIRVPNIMVQTPAIGSPNVNPSEAAATLTDKTPLKIKVLALTAAFETGLGFPDCFGAVAGNFDGQGISLGALQWNFGQGTLQPMLLKMIRNHEAVAKQIFSKDLFIELSQILTLSKEEQLAWINKYQITKQNPKTGIRRLVLDPKLAEPFRHLGKTPEMIEIQADEAGTRYLKALSNCEQYDLKTERGVALMFDINVQNGLVDKNGAGARIRQDYENLNINSSATEIQVARMIIIAKRRSEVVTAQWRNDVLSRKMTIATGQGEVHKRKYNLDDFKLSLNPYIA
jgi:hypothetical protein